MISMVEYNKDQETLDQKKWFICPICGGRIRRNKRPTILKFLANLESLSEPECEDCGRQYIIRVNEDLSYEIINN